MQFFVFMEYFELVFKANNEVDWIIVQNASGGDW